MNTVFLLMAQFDSAAVIPIDVVCRDYFAPLTVPTLLRKISAGEIPLPLVRMETSQKGAKGVHLTDLAEYIDKRRKAAVKECNQLAGVI
jgi:Pyocin activator protein PrtN